MSESGRFQAPRINDAISDLGDVREWASAYETLAEALDMLLDATETWQNAENRDDKAEARDEVEAILQQVSDAFSDLTALPSLDLGPEVTP